LFFGLFGKDERALPHGKQALDEALGAWREAEAVLPAERLSSGARANIRALARQRASVASDRPLTGLFVPLGRLVAAAGVPALLLAVSFGWFIGGGAADFQGSEASGLSVVSIDARKVNGLAVFDIANGGRIHSVYRGSSAAGLAEADLFTKTQGSFTDTLDGGSGVTYYRID